VGKKRSRHKGSSSFKGRSSPGKSGPKSAVQAGDATAQPAPALWPIPKPSKPGTVRIGLNDQQRGLATAYLPLAESMARSVKPRRDCECEDLQATAYLALVEAARNFDPARKVSFATFARHRIRGALRDYVRFLFSDSWRGTEATRPFFRRLGKNSESHGRVIGVQEEKPVGANIEMLDAVDFWLRSLPRSHALACRLIYISGKSQDEVADLLGFSKPQLSRMHREALSWLIEDCKMGRAPFDGTPLDKPARTLSYRHLAPQSPGPLAALVNSTGKPGAGPGSGPRSRPGSGGLPRSGSGTAKGRANAERRKPKDA